jgi:hypothetical protein
MEVVFPVFILEKDSGDVIRFESVAEMQHQLERIDIENREYEAWDRSGRRLDLGIQEPTWLTVRPAASQGGDAIALSDALRAYAQRAGVPVEESTNDPLTLYEAIQASIAKNRKTRGLRSLFAR